MDAIRTAQAQAPRAGDLRRGPEARDAGQRRAADELGAGGGPARAAAARQDGRARRLHRGELDAPAARQAALLTEKVAMLEAARARCRRTPSSAG